MLDVPPLILPRVPENEAFKIALFEALLTFAVPVGNVVTFKFILPSNLKVAFVILNLRIISLLLFSFQRFHHYKDRIVTH